ncbi:Bug family tripartite tricarboxylate transporter substrate binding protein [Rhodoplanes sp. Z2-YC6860]|uniref:Bug family tripartite tricarboxylate transporter substrate binding protein n=1 Tax=Rhodoplanes sp. Z2-YC6860 TaxID=674703 RepID=UPI00078CAA45|nr:tripartite tricarboxylate transporter substrate binding protein [Rhodoplanes sp. Z2-YC6860]AMN42032.1 tricarboxylate transport protein [Rhodoplanes sp. Z2-YC6860]
MLTRRRVVEGMAAIAVIPALGPISAATDDFPSRPLSLVVPYAAGGSADILPRIVAERMRVTLGQPIVFENVTGAAGNLGTGRIARAPSDGYTFGLGTWSTHVANAAVYSLTHNVESDFSAIGLLARGPLVIASRNDLPPNDLRELVAWMRAKGDALQATNGSGSVMHLAGLLLERQTGAKLKFVPYRGSAPAVQDLLAGHVDLYVGFPADVLPSARAGHLKVYAVAASARLAVAPEIPTTAEAGLPDFTVSGWFAFWGPKGIADNRIAKLNSALTDALDHDDVRSRLENDLLMLLPAETERSPEALAAFQRAEIQRWWPLMKAANLKTE